MKSLITALMFLFFLSDAAARVELDAAEVEVWADEVFGTAFDERRFSGAVISVVQDGEVVLAKGYGFADYESKLPAHPFHSCFYCRRGTATRSVVCKPTRYTSALISQKESTYV